MCNACGFMCCAYDGFSGCGCDHCDNPACWTDDDDWDGSDDDGGFYCEEVADTSDGQASPGKPSNE